MISVSAMAQHQLPPLPFEVLIGNEGVFVQSIVKRPFSDQSKFSFFNLGTYSFNYQQQPSDNDLVLLTQFTYELKNGFAAMAGGEINNAVGFAPIAGFEHSYASRKWLAVTIMSYFINSSSDVSLFGLYEFKPPINKKLALYSRLQFMYNHSLSNKVHNRSFAILRLGVKKERLSIGLASNLDQYGPEKVFKNNNGVFIAWDF